MIIINTKNYKTGTELLKLAKRVQTCDVHTILAVPAPDIALISKTGLNVYAQHVDLVLNEKTTGRLTAASVKAAGATGTLLNHSEHPLSYEALAKTIPQCKQVGLVTVVCVKTVAEATRIAQLKPAIIAFEDPALISTGKSVTTNSSLTLKKFIRALEGKPIVPLCGAGISTIKDVKAAYALGCKGVLIASAVTNVKDPTRLLDEIHTFINN